MSITLVKNRAKSGLEVTSEVTSNVNHQRSMEEPSLIKLQTVI